MNTSNEMTFIPVEPRRKNDSATLKIWAIVINGQIVGYTDEPETLKAGLPRVDSFDSYAPVLPSKMERAA